MLFPKEEKYRIEIEKPEMKPKNAIQHRMMEKPRLYQVYLGTYQYTALEIEYNI